MTIMCHQTVCRGQWLELKPLSLPTFLMFISRLPSWVLPASSSALITKCVLRSGLIAWVLWVLKSPSVSSCAAWVTHLITALRVCLCPNRDRKIWRSGVYSFCTLLCLCHLTCAHGRTGLQETMANSNIHSLLFLAEKMRGIHISMDSRDSSSLEHSCFVTVWRFSSVGGVLSQHALNTGLEPQHCTT